MELKALQARLRQFAAERDWKPFHTPKNLAMALMVEAAELAEVFQWMTPEQSQAAHNDVVLRERVADELADVLLYLVQVADHTTVDLERAVARKLVKNAQKHPPLRPGQPAGTAAAADLQTHVLVDWENVQPRDQDIRALVPDVSDVWLFHGPNQKKVDAHHASFGDRLTTVPIARAGKNALDFHLSFYMGYIASRHPDARFVVISNDKGYAPMLEHATHLGFSARQVGFGGAAAGAAPARKRVSRKTTAGAASSPVGAAGAALPDAPAPKSSAPRSPARKAVAKAGAAASTAAPGAAAQAPARSPIKAPVKAPTAAKTAAPTKASARASAKSSGQARPPAATKTAAKTPSNTPSNTAAKTTAKTTARAPHTSIGQAVRHVLAGLRKTADKPTRQARLRATVQSLLGPQADAALVDAVLSRLLADGQVAIDAKGGVRYGFA